MENTTRTIEIGAGVELVAIATVSLDEITVAKIRAANALGHRCHIAAGPIDPWQGAGVTIYAENKQRDSVTCPRCRRFVRESWLTECPSCEWPLDTEWEKR